MAPVPIYVKGGIWTNLEDQILKAAVQKYGTHAWSKVASLLQKKSSKQCQARWNEFLNPNLNFGPFSKDEDDKLMEFAKRLPNQWRTVSDLMGRPAQTLIDRYNALLSIDANDLALSTTFEVGDIHPNNESIAAKPDNGSLLDEEREMLAEARARLLNTQGKKASRRIRERMLQESKRIALLQKRRELKQAGVTSKIKSFKKKHPSQIDYNQDVIYEQEPPSGIYDTTEEDLRSVELLTNFENKVNGKGLQNFNESTATFKSLKRENEKVSSTISGSDSIITNEHKKPKLELSAPGQKISVQKGKASILHLFDLLPPPLNDFEIMPDEDESETENISVEKHSVDLQDESDAVQGIDHTQTPGSIFSPIGETFVQYTPSVHLIPDVRLPDLVEFPRDQEDTEFNRIVESKRDKKPLFESKELIDYIKQINIDAGLNLSDCEHHKVSELIKMGGWDLGQKISALEFNNNKYREDMEAAAAVRLDAVSKLTKDFIHVLKPEIIIAQKDYYTGYLRYLNTSGMLEEKKTNLLHELQFVNKS